MAEHGDPDPLADACRCNQPDDAHERGGPFCRDAHDTPTPNGARP